MRVESVHDYMDRDQRIDRVRLKDKAQRTIQSLEEIEESCSEALRSAYRVKDLADLEKADPKSIQWHISNIEGSFRRILEEARRNFNLYCNLNI